jgi:gluconate 2-dehydrogenase gamma chain
MGIGRRGFLGLGLAVGSAAAEAIARHDGMLGGPSETIQGALPWRDGMADPPPVEGAASFLNAAEMAFISAAVDRLIPPDSTGPSATQADVPTFLDRQLAGAYGQGDHFYLGGPWPKGEPSQGYQARLAPAQFYRTAIADIEEFVGHANHGKAFKDLQGDAQDKLLKQLESGDLKLPRVDSKAWFTLFLQNVLEGYFSDPIYGGNRGMSAWKMIGFPGAHYDYREWATRHNQPTPFLPVSLAGRPGWRQA